MSHFGSEHDDRPSESEGDDAAPETPDREESLEEDSIADEPDSGDGDRPMVPEGVLRGIDDIREGRTADIDDIEEVLKY